MSASLTNARNVLGGMMVMAAVAAAAVAVCEVAQRWSHTLA